MLGEITNLVLRFVLKCIGHTGSTNSQSFALSRKCVENLENRDIRVQPIRGRAFSSGTVRSLNFGIAASALLLPDAISIALAQHVETMCVNNMA